jgi:hypothetical protein
VLSRQQLADSPRGIMIYIGPWKKTRQLAKGDLARGPSNRAARVCVVGSSHVSAYTPTISQELHLIARMLQRNFGKSNFSGTKRISLSGPKQFDFFRFVAR